MPAIVVLGRIYTLYNEILNSNVPGLLRELGALAIPVDCFPLPPDTPAFTDVYWHYAQANLRAAHAIRRTDDIYPVYCSNYSCGPDSFSLHFYGYQMAHKPWAVLETDGHSGDAGTRTRLEAFLFCVAQDRAAGASSRANRPVTDFRAIDGVHQDMATTLARNDLLLIPPMGVASYVTSAALRGEGFRCETLPLPDREALALGRRHTSGKECVPMTITLGSILQRLEREKGSDEQFAFMMPTADGPCRFGVYNLLHKIVFERTGWKDRVRIVAPSDSDYFAGLAPDFQLRLWFGMVAGDVLLAALHDVRPVETSPGAAQAVFDRAFARLVDMMEHPRPASLTRTLLDIPRNMGGVRDLIREAAADFAAIKDFARDVPTVAMVGEIYVRLDPFANDFLVDRLEQCGLRVRMAPFIEWIEYTSWTQRKRLLENRPLPNDAPLPMFLTGALQEDVMDRLWGEMSDALEWGPRTTVEDAVEAGGRYVSRDLLGEAILTVGTPLAEFEAGHVDGVVSVAPLECMPAKIAEAHFLKVDRDTGLPSLSLPVIGDPVDPRLIEDFAFEVRESAQRRKTVDPGVVRLPSLSALGWNMSRKAIGTALSASAFLPLAFAMGRANGNGNNGNGAHRGNGIYLTPSPFPVTSRTACTDSQCGESSWPESKDASRS
jgi:predicted nucleotide-binding protein (sugar kinase/HSP70/actin superfamily)